MKIRPVGSKLFHAGRLTDRYDEAKSLNTLALPHFLSLQIRRYFTLFV
jgi:hypothetical protein